MSASQQIESTRHTSEMSQAAVRMHSSAKLRDAVLCAFIVISLGSCVIPMDTGANAAALALDEMDNLAYAIRNESAQMQVQMDSLAAQIRKTDSLVRWVANLTGNPIVDAPVWNFSIPTTPPPDTGAVAGAAGTSTTNTGTSTTTTKPPPR